MPFNLAEIGNAEEVLANLAGVFFQSAPDGESVPGEPEPNIEARYRVLLDQIPAVVFMAYLDRGIGEAYVSPRIEESLGFTQREWLDDPVLWYRQIHPEDKARWSEEAAEMFLSGTPLRSSYRVLARNGRVIWFQCEARLVRRTNGEPWFIHGVGFDITALKQTQEELRLARDVESAILDTVGALIVVLDREGRIVRFNRACEEITGYSEAEATGMQAWDLFSVPEEAAAFRNIASLIRGGATRTEYEGHWVTRDGKQKIISWTVKTMSAKVVSPSLIPGGESHAPFIIASGIDVTEQRKADTKFRGLLEAAPDAVVVVDQHGKIVLVNAQFENLFGYHRQEMLGKGIESLVPERLHTAHATHRRNYLAEPHTRQMGAGLELYARRKDGSEFPAEISLSPLETEEGVLISSSIRDITDRKRAEQLVVDSLREKEVLLKEIHHRVKNNLAVISSLLYLESTYEHNASVVEVLRESQRRIRSMALVHESLYRSANLAAVEFGEYAVGLCRELIRSQSLPAGGRIAFESDVVPVDMHVDLAVPCGLILNELVTNALKHAFPGRRDGAIRLILSSSGNACTLCVADDGVGMSAPPQDKPATMGMRVIYALTRQIEGRLEIASSTSGTRAALTFPLKPA